MATGLDPLGNDRVATSVGCGESLAYRTDLPKRQPTSLVNRLNSAQIRLPPEQLDYRSRIGCQLKLLTDPIEILSDEADAPRTIGMVPHPIETVLQRLETEAMEHPDCPRTAQNPKSPSPHDSTPPRGYSRPGQRQGNPRPKSPCSCR